MKATGIVRRIDDLGRVVIPKEIRRTMRIREGDPSLTVLTQEMRFCIALLEMDGRTHIGLGKMTVFGNIVSNTPVLLCVNTVNEGGKAPIL